MAIKWKSNRIKGILIVVFCAMLASSALCSAYPYFRERAKERLKAYEEDSKKVREQFQPDEGFERYLLSSIYYMNYEMTPDMDAYGYFTQNYDTKRLSSSEQAGLSDAASRLMKNMRNQYRANEDMYRYRSYAVSVEKNFGTDSSLESTIYNGKSVGEELYQAGIVISYDGRGMPEIRSVWGIDETALHQEEILEYLRTASMAQLMEDNGLEDGDYYEDIETMQETAPLEAVEAEVADAYEADAYEEALYNDELLKTLPLPKIQNASFAFGIYADNNYRDWQEYWIEQEAYMNSGYSLGVLLLALGMVLLSLLLQNVPALGLRENRLFCLPPELILYAGFLGIAATVGWAGTDFAVYSMDGSIAEMFMEWGVGEQAASLCTTGLIWLIWACFSFCWYWLSASVLPYLTHPIRTFRERALCLSICRWLKSCWLKLYHWATDIELDEKLTRNIWKAVGLNAVVVALLCFLWIGGTAGVIIYSIVLYVLVKRKCAGIIEDYRRLLGMTRTIAKGDLSASTEEDMGLFNPVRDELASIQDGFQKAVREEVRSKNMRTELITNVSHDLKTPLTAIITYVDLLKKEGLTEEERRGYVDTLDRKSQRLKVLIEDLFEVSKATTDNIVMNFENVDLVNLIKQVHLENEDKIADSTLDIRWMLPDGKCVLSLDPQRTFRIIDNLLQNILKYSMPHSRVYIELKDKGREAIASFKNISAVEMNFSPEEITERFARGDLSRNTEGSGLGLAIAQSFTELQNGTFKVETDGDLFKVTLCFPKPGQEDDHPVDA